MDQHAFLRGFYLKDTAKFDLKSFISFTADILTLVNYSITIIIKTYFCLNSLVQKWRIHFVSIFENGKISNNTYKLKM